MRTEKIPDFETDEELDDFYDEQANVSDHRERPSDVLRQVDEELAEHGLEVIMYDFHGDSYVWSIGPRRK